MLINHHKAILVANLFYLKSSCRLNQDLVNLYHRIQQLSFMMVGKTKQASEPGRAFYPYFFIAEEASRGQKLITYVLYNKSIQHVMAISVAKHGYNWSAAQRLQIIDKPLRWRNFTTRPKRARPWRKTPWP